MGHYIIKIFKYISKMENSPVKSIKIGINGFGRIGRMVLRAAIERKEIEVVAINDPFIATDYMVYQYKYDSTQGICKNEVKSDANNLIIDGWKIRIFQECNPKTIDWNSQNIQFVAECTGVFKNLNQASMHLTGSVKKVIVS